uniref:Small ribosomal subunit protein uS19c n=1 Tax=Chloropicon mariensis TaxID=1606511 RepID=A0A4D6C5S4_9CHLO|nr:ribosomal protein S19 [Chloropicon mariensis]QBX98717.1 ribosomal protein S19 [Chloropicon mariensis]
MPRSAWKGPFVDFGLLRSIIKKQQSPKDKSLIKVYSRRSMILPEFVGLEVEIHNGKSFQKVLLKEEMIGHSFGEFAPTRKIFVPKDKKKNKK